MTGIEPMEISKKRVNVSLDDDVLSILDTMAKMNGRDRSNHLNQIILQKAVEIQLISKEYCHTRFGLPQPT